MPDIGLGLGRERGIVAFEIERRLAGHQEQFGLESAGQREALAGADRRRDTTSGASTLKIELAASVASVASVP